MGSIHLVKGSDEALVSAAVSELVHRSVGDGDRSLMVDEMSGDDYAASAIVDSAQTPPFLTDKRVVVARGIGRFSADELAPLVAYLTSPLDTTDLILEGTGGRLAKSLSDAAAKSGATITDADAPSNKKDRGYWFDEQLIAAGVNLDSGARALMLAHLGDDMGRLASLLAVLTATFGPIKLTAGDVEPFLGEAGAVAPWDLTDAIDRGDTAGSLTMLHRMMTGRHPLQAMSVLHSHYQRALALDGSNARSEAAAAQRLGVKSTFQAKKALTLADKLGSAGITRSFELLGQADLDLRGATGIDEVTVMEVLVARLSRLGAGSSRRR